MARIEAGRGLGRELVVVALGSFFLAGGVVPAQAQQTRPAGRGFIFGGAIGGGRLGFPGGSGQALALLPVTGERVTTGSSSLDVRDAKVIAAGATAPGAERIVPFPASASAGGFSMHGGYAFNRRVAVLLDVAVAAGLGSEGFNHATGAVVVRLWPASRLWLECGPASGELGYGYESSVVRSGSIRGLGAHGAAGVSVLRRSTWSLDLEARVSSIGYDGFRVTTTAFAIGASRLPR